MCEALQLLLGSLAVGDVFVSPSDPSHRAIGVVQRSGGNSDIDKGAILPPALGLDVPDALAAARPLVKRQRLRPSFRRHYFYRCADCLLGGVSIKQVRR